MFMNTRPTDSTYTLTDEYAKPEVTPQDQSKNPRDMIPGIGDIPVATVNRLLYCGHKATRKEKKMHQTGGRLDS